MKKGLSILLSLVLVLSAITILPAQFAAEDIDTADTGADLEIMDTGRTVDEAMAWVQSQVGQSIGSGECVAFIQAYYSYLGVSAVSGNGSDYTWNSLPSGWQRIQGAQPQRGDILVYTGGTNNWGHVAIYESDYVTYHQNFGGARYVTRVTYKYNGINNPYWGVIRPSFGNSPQGCLDVVEGGTGSIHVRGWAFDRDNTSSALSIHVYIGGPAGTSGVDIKSITANGSRPDVDNVYHTGANHGFDATLSTSKSGSQAVYVYAINIGSGENIELGHATVNITQISGVNIGDDFYANIITGKGGYAIGVQADNTRNVCVRTRDDSDDQKWHFQRNSDGTYRITNVGQGKCLDVYGGTANFLENIQVYESNDSNAQKWYLKLTDSGYVFIPKCNVASAMDVADANFSNGGNIRDHQTNDSAAQIFTINYVDLSPAITATFNGHTYELYDLTCNWHQAEVTCERLGGHLATVTTEGENTFVYGLKNQATKSDYLWLGATDEINEGTWQWMTDESFSYHPWASSQPDNANSAEHYLEMNSDSSWNDLTRDYNGHHPVFVCEYDNEEVVASHYSPAKTTTYNNVKYEYYDTKVTWQTAKAICEAKGGHLVIIDDAAENQAMADLAQAQVWQGISDLDSEGIWKDVYGREVSYTNWSANNPDNYKMCENYGEIYKEGTWNDGRYVKLGFICEYNNPICDHEMSERFVEAPADGEQGYIFHECSKCGDSYKDNYMDYNDGWYTPADGSSDLPALIKNDSQFKKQYNNTYEKIQIESPGEGWVNKGVARTEWVNKGQSYDSYSALPTSNSRVLVKECYYHYCIPGAGANSEANYEKSGSFTHYDEFLLPNSNISVEWTGDDNGHTVYVLKWIDHIIYCKSGDSCDGSDGTHDYRSKAWYHKYVYQDKQEVVYYKWVKDSGWTDAPDPSADKTTARFQVEPDPAILGDADGDGEIAAIDVTQIMRSCAHISTGIDKDVMMNADVDGNGLLEITDATYIQRYLARQQTPYAIGQKK